MANGVKCNITLVFHPAQSLPFLKINATYVSLILGRVEDFGLDVMGRVDQTRRLIDRLGSKSKLLVASFREPNQLLEGALNGADVITVPPSTWAMIYDNPLSLSGEDDFLTAWDALPEALRKSYEELGELNRLWHY